jgi:hypothetical protein
MLSGKGKPVCTTLRVGGPRGALAGKGGSAPSTGALAVALAVSGMCGRGHTPVRFIFQPEPFVSLKH